VQNYETFIKLGNT